MKGGRYDNYSDFWHAYLREHSDRRTRVAHYAGTSLALVAAASFAITANWVWLVAMPIVAYGFAWAGHGFIERNWPATFTHPLWSLISDVRMLIFAVTGRLRAHLLAANKK